MLVVLVRAALREDSHIPASQCLMRHKALRCGSTAMVYDHWQRLLLAAGSIVRCGRAPVRIAIRGHSHPAVLHFPHRRRIATGECRSSNELGLIAEDIEFR